MRFLGVRDKILLCDNLLKQERKGDNTMKKKLLKLLGMLVILCMLVATVGCSSKNNTSDDDDKEKEPSVVGTWEAEMDLAAAMNDMLGESLGIETEFKDLSMKVTLELKKDNTYKFAADEDSAETFVDNFLEQFKDVMKAVVEDAAKEYDMTFDEFLAEMGYASFDAFFEEAAAGMDAESLVGEFASEEDGAYKFKGNKLWLGEGDGIDEETYYVIKLTDDTMTWKEATGTEEEMSEYLLPLKFTKK